MSSSPTPAAASGNTPSADCYAGIAPRWHVDVWGDHSREAALVSLLAGYDSDAKLLRIHPAFPNILKMYGVSHVLSPYPQQGTMLQLVGHDGHAYVYRVPGAARVRVVRAARHVTTDRRRPASARFPLRSRSRDPAERRARRDPPDRRRDRRGERPARRRPAGPSSRVRTPARARDRRRGAGRTVSSCSPTRSIRAGPRQWTARARRSTAPITPCAASSCRKGRHEVRFTYEAPGYIRGLQITLLSLSLLLLWAGGAAYAGRRTLGQRHGRDQIDRDGTP